MIKTKTEKGPNSQLEPIEMRAKIKKINDKHLRMFHVSIELISGRCWSNYLLDDEKFTTKLVKINQTHHAYLIHPYSFITRLIRNVNTQFPYGGTVNGLLWTVVHHFSFKYIFFCFSFVFIVNCWCIYRSSRSCLMTSGSYFI